VGHNDPTGLSLGDWKRRWTTSSNRSDAHMNKQPADLALRQSFVTGRSSTARHAVGLRPLRARAQHNEDQRQWHEGCDDTFEKFGRLQSGSRRPGYPNPIRALSVALRARQSSVARSLTPAAVGISPRGQHPG
jgi:hypothetical protein